MLMMMTKYVICKTHQRQVREDYEYDGDDDDDDFLTDGQHRCHAPTIAT